jgi:hypothetical protein
LIAKAILNSNLITTRSIDHPPQLALVFRKCCGIPVCLCEQVDLRFHAIEGGAVVEHTIDASIHTDLLPVMTPATELFAFRTRLAWTPVLPAAVPLFPLVRCHWLAPWRGEDGWDEGFCGWLVLLPWSSLDNFVVTQLLRSKRREDAKPTVVLF